MKKPIKKTKKFPPLERIANTLEEILAVLSMEKIAEIQVNEMRHSALSETKSVKKLTIKEFPDFVGKTRYKLYEYLKNEYASKLAGEDEISDIFKNPGNYPELKDGNWHYFFGEIFFDTDGDWRVPCVYWDGWNFFRHGHWLAHDWFSNDRVVLIEIQ